jgi:hypothetical protein
MARSGISAQRRWIRPRPTILILGALAITTSVFAGSATSVDEIDAVADGYLEAVRSSDWERMSSFLAAESHYQDFSMEHFDRPMIDLKGPEAIVEFWRSSGEGAGTVEIRFDVEERFTAGPNVYLIISSYVRNRGGAWGLPDHEIEARFRQLTHLRIRDGKVLYHADHVDYADAERQVEEQKKRLSPAPDSP